MLSYETRLGEIKISYEYLAKLIGNAVTSCYGVVGMAPGGKKQKLFNILNIKDIPVLGEIVSGHNVITYLAFISAFVIWFLLFKTRLGLRIRAVGENADAARSVGINVFKTKSTALIIAGVLSGMGGAYMSMGYVSWYVKNMTAGRGWIGIAAAAMSGQHPLIGTLSALLFGVADSVSNTLQTLNLPSQLVLMIPYVVTILAMCGYAYYALKKRQRRQ